MREERRRVHPPPDPTRANPDDELTTLLTLSRPRGRKPMAGSTWKGAGRHGEWEKGEEEHPERLEAMETGVDDPDGSDASWLPVDVVDVVEADQGVEDRLQGDPHPRRRRGWQA